MLKRALAYAVTYLAVSTVCIGIAMAEPIPPIPAPVAPLSREHPLSGRIVRVSDGVAVVPAELVRIATTRDFILLGEKHDNPDHHRLQAWVIAALVASGRRPAVAMEMLDTNQSPVITEYRKDGRANPADFGIAVGWTARGWPDWSIYEPIAAAAFRAGLPIFPADLPQEALRAVSRGGLDVLDSNIRARLLMAPHLDADQTASLNEELRTSHCGQLPERALPRMGEVQWVRDAHMALAMIEAARIDKSSMLIAGAGHVRADRGVPWHLRHMAPRKTSLALAFIEVDDSHHAIGDYALNGRFEYAWFTPRVDNDDPCAKFHSKVKRQ